MTLRLDPPELHRDFSVWHYDRSLAFAVPVPTELVRRLLPKGLHPFEPKPQVSLLMLTVMQLMEGNHGFEGPLTQVTASVNVMPDLGLAGRMPAFACYVLNVGVTDLAFAADAYNTDRLPFHDKPLTVAIDPVGLRASVRDADGPIFTLGNVAPRTPFARREDFYQVFASDGGQLLHGAMTTDAEVFEHQVAGDAGAIHDHPFFRGLGFATDRAESFMQVLSGDEALGIQHFYRLRAV